MNGLLDGPYGDGDSSTEDVYNPRKNKITQSLAEFLEKYKDAIGPDGKFIPGKANLYFDGMSASDVYYSIIGQQNGTGRGAFAPERRGDTPVFNSEVNADWIEDNRPGGGWASVKDGVLPIAATIGAMYGGSMLLGEGLGAGLGAEAGYGVMPELGVTIPQAGAAIGSSGYAPIAAETLAGITGGAGGAGLLGSGGYGVMPELGVSIPQAGAPIASSGFAPLAPETLAGITGGGGLLDTIGGALKPVGTAISGINDLTGGNLGAIIGGIAGAASSGDTTTSQSKDPWGPAQSYLKDNLAQNKRMQDYYSANPFSQEQKQAYQGLLNTNANGLSNAGNYNQIAQNFMGSNRGLLATMPTLNQGVTAPQVDWTKYANIGKGG